MEILFLCLRKFGNYSSLDLLVAACTAFMAAARKPISSKTWQPVMVVPPGEDTMSFSCAGCMPVSSIILAAPITVWAARR